MIRLANLSTLKHRHLFCIHFFYKTIYITIVNRLESVHQHLFDIDFMYSTPML